MPPPESPQSQATSAFRTLLGEAAKGRDEAVSQLEARAYEELRKLARARRRKSKPGDTLHTTVLIHEAWLRLNGQEEWNGRAHFYGAAARAMRNLVVDYFRKRRGVQSESTPDEIPVTLPGFTQTDFLTLSEAMERLEQEHERSGKVVTLRFFAGLTHQEIADALGITTRTVDRDWTFARAWLHREMGGKGLQG